MAYFDDSGTHVGSPVIVIGGLLGLADDWNALQAKWRAKLANPIPEVSKPPLRAFHLSHCVGHYGEFERYTETESLMLRHDFRQMILDSKLYQLSLAIPCADWEELVVPPYRDFMGTAEEACFVTFIDRSMEIVRSADIKRLKIAYVYDGGRETERLAYLTSLFKQYADNHPEFGSFTFATVTDTPPLQAADTIATENYWAVQKWIADGNISNASIHFMQLRENMAGEGMILDREAIQAEINRRGSDGKLL